MLVECSECKAVISDKAYLCVYCGAPTDPDEEYHKTMRKAEKEFIMFQLSGDKKLAWFNYFAMWLGGLLKKRRRHVR